MGKSGLRGKQKTREYRKFRSSRRFINIGKGIPGSCCDACTISEVCFDKCKGNCSSCDIIFCARFTNIKSKINYSNMREFVIDITEEFKKMDSEDKCLRVSVSDLEEEFECSGSTAKKWLDRIFNRAKLKIMIKLNNDEMYFVGE